MVLFSITPKMSHGLEISGSMVCDEERKKIHEELCFRVSCGWSRFLPLGNER